MDFNLLCVLCCVLWGSLAVADEISNEVRPYEFSFNIVDFQHRYEMKNTDGIITGEFGFITADGVYHETGYATDKNGDFIITRMRNRRITSLKDALEIFKDRPEAAKKLVEAVAMACSSCKIPIKEVKVDGATQTASTTATSSSRSKLGPELKQTTKSATESATESTKIDFTDKTTLPEEKNKIPEKSKELSNERRGKSLPDGLLKNMVDALKNLSRKEEIDEKSKDAKNNEKLPEKMADDLYYRFNYTITSHAHQEVGYKNGEKDGSYRAQSENGVDTQVKYLSNEFGHQPNVSFVPRVNGTTEGHRLQGYSFLWNWS